MRTMYDEGLREVSIKVLSNLGLNPYALRQVVLQYIRGSKRRPYYIDYQPWISEEELGPEIFIHISTPGYLGKGYAEPRIIDQGILKLLLRSYFNNISPMPISFLFMGVEVNIRTKSMPEFKKKNIARNIFDPTKTRLSKKKKDS